MVFKFKKTYFWSFELLGSPKRDPVRVFKNMGTVGQISGRVWTRPSPRGVTCQGVFYRAVFSRYMRGRFVPEWLWFLVSFVSHQFIIINQLVRFAKEISHEAKVDSTSGAGSCASELQLKVNCRLKVNWKDFLQNFFTIHFTYHVLWVNSITSIKSHL